jgi:hypothetical protein
MAYNPADFELVETPTGSAPPYNPADFDLVDDGQTGLIEGVGNSIKRGWTMSQMASEMEKPAPDPQRVAALQQEMQAAPPSDEYMTVMDDRRAPEESWTAFKSAPVKVLAELMGESFSAFAGQMIQKAPNRVAIGLPARCRDGRPSFMVSAPCRVDSSVPEQALLKPAVPPAIRWRWPAVYWKPWSRPVCRSTIPKPLAKPCKIRSACSLPASLPSARPCLSPSLTVLVP